MATLVLLGIVASQGIQVLVAIAGIVESRDIRDTPASADILEHPDIVGPADILV